MSLQETPQDYYTYFHGQRLSAEPPATKWAIGEQAAQLWVDYHEQHSAGIDTLIALIRILMPYRYADSGFYGLWQCAIRHSCDLPVSSQVALWREIFTPTNHGDRPIKYTEEALAVIQQWHNLAANLPHQAIEPTQVHQLVEMIAPYLVRSYAYEWIALTNGLHAWVETIAPETPFIDLVFERHNQLLSG